MNECLEEGQVRRVGGKVWGHLVAGGKETGTTTEEVLHVTKNRDWCKAENTKRQNRKFKQNLVLAHVRKSLGLMCKLFNSACMLSMTTDVFCYFYKYQGNNAAGAIAGQTNKNY